MAGRYETESLWTPEVMRASLLPGMTPYFLGYLIGAIADQHVAFNAWGIPLGIILWDRLILRERAEALLDAHEALAEPPLPSEAAESIRDEMRDPLVCLLIASVLMVPAAAIHLGMMGGSNESWLAYGSAMTAGFVLLAAALRLGLVLHRLARALRERIRPEGPGIETALWTAFCIAAPWIPMRFVYRNQNEQNPLALMLVLAAAAATALWAFRRWRALREAYAS